MVTPNNLISHIRKMFNCTDYLSQLKEQAIPVMKLNLGYNYCFQQDNAAVHTAIIIKELYVESGIHTLKWAAKSPDINITEDIWSLEVGLPRS